LLVAIAGNTQGCDCLCDEPVLVPIPIAECRISDGTDTSCGGDDRRSYRFGSCRASGCESDADCCPGTRCRLDFNACVPNQLDPEFQCDEDADCPDPAMSCQEVSLGERPPLPVCAYTECAGDSDCELGRVCFHNVCVETAPCGGGCPDGEVCDVATSRCAPTPDDPLQAIRCHEPCGAFEMMVLQTPSTMVGEICCALACQCKALPPIIPTSYGKYSRIVATPDEIMVSAYDSQFGDLVVIHYKADGSLSHIEYVDGVPLGGAQIADPNGPRKGVGEPGPDVGTHTSIAADSNNRARVAYHDVDNRLLKVAIQQDDGTWTSYPLDNPGGDGTVGKFTDLDIDPQTGTIYVSYLALEVIGAPGITGAASGAKLARSRGPNPTGPGDWDIFWVDARPTFDPCDGDCGAGQACVLDSGEPVCANETTGCPDPCSSAEFCTEGQPDPLCRATAIPPSVLDFPKARGLYSSVSADGPTAHLAYYDSIDGDLRVATVNSGGQATIAVLDGDGADGHRGGDVGRFPHVRKVADDLLIVYEDFTRHELRAWQGASAAAGGTYSTVDVGKISGDPGKRFVGAGARVDFDDNGDPVVVYQDATKLDLKLARRDNGNWAPQLVVEDGAHGFYSDVKVQGDSAFIVSVQAQLDGRGRERSRAALTVQSLP
jgi:hypothetical protein